MATPDKTLLEEITGTVDEIIKQVRRLIREGSARNLIIKNKDGKELFKSQLTVGVAGTTILAVMAPLISAITMFLMFANGAKVYVERDVLDSDKEEEDEYGIEGEVIDIKNGDDDDDEDDDDSKTDKTVGKGD